MDKNSNWSEISKDINKGSFLDLLKIKNLWFIFPLVLIHYAPVAGIRGLWIGPYINDTFGEDGNLAFATTAMSLSMIAGTWPSFSRADNIWHFSFFILRPWLFWNVLPFDDCSRKKFFA